MMFPHIVESDCYIYINISETHSGNCEKYTAHAQNIILTLMDWAFLTCLGLGEGYPPASIRIFNNQNREP